MNAHSKKDMPVDKFTNRQLECIHGTGYFCEIPFASLFTVKDYDLRIGFQERQEADLNNFIYR
jgi:hypothetical protein